MLSRCQERENIITAIYDNLIRQKANIDYDINQTLTSAFYVDNLEDISLFCKQIYLGVYKNYDQIVNLVQSKLVKWEFNRLNDLAQALFLEIVSEGYILKLTPKAVLIDFAITYAKKYLSSKDYKYINAVLDKILENWYVTKLQWI